MRHRRATKKLSRNTSNRKALLRSLVTNLITYERISTTYEKAKEASILADRLITLGKKSNITAKKNAISLLGSKILINKLFDEIAPRFVNRAGGYTRIMQLAPRKGDGAKMAVLELTERKIIEKAPKKKEKIQPAEAEEKKKTTEPISTKEKVEEEKGKEKAKSEKERLKKGFFKGLKRYFRGKAP